MEDETYEQRLHEECVSAGVFNPSVQPDDLYNLATKDLTTAAIEESLQSAVELDRSSIRNSASFWQRVKTSLLSPSVQDRLK
jgi:hypothetical protein